MSYVLMMLLFLVSLFLILLVLIQRGKGGGLVGAFGGMGGQSAFGTKAGDVFTKVTIVTALTWFFLCVAAIKWMGSPESLIRGASSGPLGGAGAESTPGASPTGPTTGEGPLEGTPTGGLGDTLSDAPSSDGIAADGPAGDAPSLDAASGDAPAGDASGTPEN